MTKQPPVFSSSETEYFERYKIANAPIGLRYLAIEVPFTILRSSEEYNYGPDWSMKRILDYVLNCLSKQSCNFHCVVEDVYEDVDVFPHECRLIVDEIMHLYNTIHYYFKVYGITINPNPYWDLVHIEIDSKSSICKFLLENIRHSYGTF